MVLDYFIYGLKFKERYDYPHVRIACADCMHRGV